LLGLFPEFERHRRRGRLTGFEAGQVVEKLRASSAYRARLAEIAIEDRELGVAYLQQEIDFTERSAFVEYWGRGYTQDCLVRLVEQAAEGHREVPFYYARSIYPTRGASARHNYTSSAHSLLLVEALFANLPYGTTEGYVQGEKAIEPRLSVRQHDEELRLAIEEMTPRFALDLLDLPLLDRDALTRDAFRFGFEHFRRQPTFPDYMEHIAHLHDSVELGGIEREFAPSFGVKDFIDYLRGRPLGEITRSLPMTLQRSRGLGPRLLTLQREVGFRRVAKRLTARVFDSFGRGGSRSTDDMVTSNPPIPMSPETTHLTSVPSEVSGSSGEPVATPVGGALSR